MSLENNIKYKKFVTKEDLDQKHYWIYSVKHAGCFLPNKEYPTRLIIGKIVEEAIKKYCEEFGVASEFRKANNSLIDASQFCKSNTIIHHPRAFGKSNIASALEKHIELLGKINSSELVEIYYNDKLIFYVKKLHKYKSVSYKEIKEFIMSGQVPKEFFNPAPINTAINFTKTQ